MQPDHLDPATLGRLRLQQRIAARQAADRFLASHGFRPHAEALREPDRDETPLSIEEILHAERIGVISLGS